jgi:osomolarity two-component system, sensor histidine kinase CHK1
MALVPESEQATVHGLIGRHLLRRMKLEDQIDSYVFEICNQFNKASEGLTAEEIDEVIELNLRAGRTALKATAFDGASGYFQVAWSLLGDNPWGKRRALALDVYLANVERLFAAAQLEEGNAILDLI